jgi:hypothetical protein
MALPFTLSAVALAAAPGGNPAPPPVQVKVAVAPAAVAPGSDAKATVTLAPNEGIKLNKYPRIKVLVPAADGVVGAAEASVGNAAPPSGDNLDANYYHGAVDPVVVTLHVDPKAASGAHDVAATLAYAYCVASSGYCTQTKVPLKIPLTVR